MLEVVLAEPTTLSPDERYLCGHYLAYLLGVRGGGAPYSAASSTPKTPTVRGCSWG